jgi:hypothetical protein
MVLPIVPGSGKRLFGPAGRTSTLTLSDCRALQPGTVILTDHPASA